MLGGQSFTATGIQFDQKRPVFKLNINYTTIDKFLRFVFRPLSLGLSQTWMQPVHLLLGPRLLLPGTVILKQRVDDNKGTIAAFDTEVESYTRCQRLQGSLMPYYYGKALCGTVPALIFSQATGKMLRELSSKERAQALPAIKKGYESLSDVSVIHGDPRLDHMFYDAERKRIMFIDFDLALLDEREEVARTTNRGDCLDIENELKETIEGH